MSSAIRFNLDQSKNLSSGNEFMKTDDVFGEKAFSKHYGEKKGEKKLVTLWKTN